MYLVRSGSRGPGDGGPAATGPSARLLVTEPVRGLVDHAALLLATPVLAAAPRGDGHGVLVLPGLFASDTSTVPLRGFLRWLGYDVRGWDLGRNHGPTDAVLAGLPRAVLDHAERTGRPVSLVGWSLGGVYAREMARRHPRMIRQVITLGSPFALRDLRQSHAHRPFRRLRHLHADEADLPSFEQRVRPVSVPSTAVYSRLDGVVAWQTCIEPETALHQNVEVRCSHLGFGADPATLWLVADRLAVPAGPAGPVPAAAGPAALVPAMNTPPQAKPAPAEPAPAKPAPWAFAAPWGARGYVSDLDGPVHWIEFGDEDASGRDGTPIVFVHGLGGSHLNWCLIGPRLAEGRRAVALDLHGFGLTPGTRATSNVHHNAMLLNRFVREVTGTPVILAGNSMGGLISILQASAAPDTVAGLVLIDPALPPPRRVPDRQVGSRFLMYALPGIGEVYLRSVQSRQPPQLAVQRVIELCFADPSRIDPAMFTASIALASERQRQGLRAGNEAFLAASRSLMRVVGLRRRYREMMASVRVPVLLLGGEADRLVPVASMREAAARNPGWETVILPGVGHTPQLEVPDSVTGTLRYWLRRHF